MFKRILACLMVLLTLVSYLPPMASAEETQPQEETTEVSATQPSEPETVPTEPTAAAEETTAPTQPETTPAEETSADETLPEETLVDTYALPGDDGAVASGKCGENLTWSIDVEGGTLTISGTGAMWDYTDIVENGMIHTTAPWYAYSPVKLILEEGISHIGDYAFEGCSSITGSLTLPESLTSIGHYAFRCGGFTGGLTLPEGLKSIGVGAFMGWSSLTSVTIPRSVTSIDSSAFSFCENMENIFVAEGNTGYTSVNGVLFNKNITTLVTYPTGKKGTTYQIPEGVTEISVYSFGGCNNLTGVTIPEGVTVIGGVAFLNCSNLTSVTIPESVTEIGMGAFNSCLSLTSITIPKGVTYIDEFTFNECHSLTSVVIPRSVTRIGSSAFSGCDGLKDVYYAGSQSQWNGIEISDGNDSLLSADIHFDPSGSTGSGTFGDNLTWSVDAEGTLTISGTGAIPDFEYVTGETPNSIYGGANTPWRSYLIRKVVVNEGITSVGSMALAYLEEMESISLPASLRELGNHALANNFGLKQIVLPENLETLDEMALFQCIGLSSLHIPAGVKSIGESAIDGCHLDSITVDEANTAFCAEDGVLYTKDKKELLAITSNRTELTIPDSVTRVGSALFFDGQNIVSVTIGAQCDWGMNLSLCNSLEQITVVDSNPNLCAKDNVLFSKDGTELIVYPSARPSTSYMVPAGTKKIGIQAFGDCQNLTSIVLPDGLTEIDSSGIGCAYLAETTIPASVTTISQESVGFHHGTKLQNLVIRGAAGSAAENYAKENGFTFVEIGATSGKCGENLTWSVDAGGTLTISGTGAMQDYDAVSENGNWRTTAPWYALSPVKLVLNEGISYIGREAFRGCGFAGSLTIPKSVTRLGLEAFRDCQNLTNVAIPASLTSIKYGAFAGCTGLTSVTIPEGVTAIEPFAFRNCSSLTGVVIPEGVTCIPDFAFDGCASLTSVTIPESVTSVSHGAFEGCSSLKDVYYLGTQAQWEEITVYGSNEPLLDAELHVNSAGYVVFGSCGENLTWGIDTDGTLTISGTGDMQDYDVVSENDAWHTTAPWYAYSPKKLVLEEGITHVGKSAFVGCGFTGELTIPKGVTDIGYRAFGYCSGFTGSVTLPEGLTKIGSSAFAFCSGLTGVTLPQRMTEIGWSTFAGCSSLVDMVIPEGVTAIEGSAFSGCSSLTSVTLPQSVTRIGISAFAECSSLSSAAIPEGVRIIEDYAFCGCSSLTSVTIPGSVTDIYDSVFVGCSSLENIFVDAGNADYASADGVLFSKDHTTLLAYPAGREAAAYRVPDGVTIIGESAFAECKNLTSVVIPEGVTSIGSPDFDDCDVPHNGPWPVFSGCSSLTSVTIPRSVASISDFAFDDCSGLKDVYYAGNQAQWNKIKIGDGNEPLLGAKLHLITGYGICGENLTWILTEDGVLTISGTGEMTDYPNFADVPWNAYREKILSVVMEPGVTSVGRYAFFQCINMTSVEMPEGVTSIGNNAFSACRNLTSVVIPESVTNIGFAAFMACNGLTSVTIPAGVASISSTSFGACFILENIFVDEGNTVYASADGILFNKDQTTLITYPAGKKNTTYIIPEGVTNIASCAVYNCGYLTSVTIPRSVASIGDNAFDFCYNLRDISVDEGNEAYASVDGVLFNKDRTVLVAYPAGKENTAYTIPDGVTNVGRSAFWDCMLTSIVIPESVTKIEWGAFRDCSNLKDVYYVGSQRQWEQVQIAEYNEPLLNAAIHFNSVGPCPELTFDREYITLSVGAEPVQLQSFPEYARKAVVWSVENPDGVNVIEVSGDGCVTPLNAGTAYVVASLNTGDGTLTARCRVDVTGTAGSGDVLGVDLGTKKVTTELYSTDYAKIDILLLLEQNEVALFAMPADNGSAITGAYLEDENARQFFDLRVKDDRQLLLVPTQEALDNAKGVKSSYSSKIVVLVNGVEYHTDDAVTISVKKTMPKLKAANLTFNPFYTEQSQALTITGGTVTKVEGTTPEWLTMDGTKLTLSNAPKSGSASLNLLVYTTEWAIPVNVKASVKLSYKAPRLKLSASSVTLSETDSLGVTLKLTAGKQSLEELNVKSVTLPAGFEDTELNLYTGEIALVPIGEIPTGKQAVRVSFYGTDSVLDLPLRVNKRTPTLRLSKTSVSLNAELGDSMTLKVTATPADLDLAKVTVTNPSEALEVSPVNENGEFTVTVKQGSASKASYALMVQAPTGKAAKLTVKTLAAGQKVTMSLKAAGSIDLTFPEKGVALQPKYRNYAGELENVVYTLALKQGKVTLDAAFDDYLTIGEDGLIRWNGAGSLESGNVCLITMTGELPNGTMLFATAQVRVTQTPVILRLSKASLSLNKRLEEKTQVTVTTSTRGYTLGDVELLVTDNKNVPSDGLTAAYENGLLTLSVNEKTVYGGSYKVQLWVTPKRVTTLMVRIPAEKKSAVTMTARARGGIDVIRDASEVVVTPTYRNCLDGASLKKQVKVTWAQDGRNYSQDVTEDFILTWAQDGTLHVSKVPGKELALTGKYRLEILCEGMEKEAYTALSVKCGTARFTVASVSLYAKDANDMARLTITTTDKTVNTLERVELKDARLKGTYEVLDLGGGQFALCLIPGAKAKTGTVTLNLFCEGNTTAKPSGTVSVKVEIR
ncbi:MAG: leucine-rich repeat protein [Oscillospiraceae bacterium]